MIRTPIVPLITQPAPDAPIELGELTLEWTPMEGQPRQPIVVSVRQFFQPKTKLILSAELPEITHSGAIQSQITQALYWPGTETVVAKQIISSNMRVGGENPGVTIEWSTNMPVFDRRQSKEPISTLHVHLFSFREFAGTMDLCVQVPRPDVDPSAYSMWRCGYIELQAGDWHITLSAHADTADWIKLCDQGADYALTHTLRVKRADGQPFQPEDAEEVLRALHHLISFAAGRWIAMGYEIGLGADGTRVWERLGLRNGSRWKKGGSWNWWNDRFGGTDLVSLWTGFWSLWQDPVWKKHLREVLYWYLEAGQQDREAISVDSGLILAQAALERLAWAYLVQKTNTVKTEEWGTMKGNQWPADRQIRRTCKLLEIPVQGADFSHAGFEDVPEMVTHLRNNAIHPDATLKGGANLAYDGWNHALWLIEMILLRLAGYEGQYANRLKSGTRWVGQTEPMPWNLPKLEATT